MKSVRIHGSSLNALTVFFLFLDSTFLPLCVRWLSRILLLAATLTYCSLKYTIIQERQQPGTPHECHSAGAQREDQNQWYEHTPKLLIHCLTHPCCTDYGQVVSLLERQVLTRKWHYYCLQELAALHTSLCTNISLYHWKKFPQNKYDINIRKQNLH